MILQRAHLNRQISIYMWINALIMSTDVYNIDVIGDLSFFMYIFRWSFKVSDLWKGGHKLVDPGVEIVDVENVGRRLVVVQEVEVDQLLKDQASRHLDVLK